MLDETDAIALRHVAGGLTVSAKPDRTLVTQADTEIETHLRDRIADAFPSHTIAGEEFGTAEDAGDGRWIIDPIDATHNVVRGIEVFATLLAFERDGELEVGVVSAPAHAPPLVGDPGGGAAVRVDGAERPIHVSPVDALAQRPDHVFDASRNGRRRPRRRAPASTSASWRDRGFGDFWGHMLVAQGSAEAMLEYGVNPWDMAAPHLIVTEAGGRMTDLRAAHRGPGRRRSRRTGCCTTRCWRCWRPHEPHGGPTARTHRSVDLGLAALGMVLAAITSLAVTLPVLPAIVNERLDIAIITAATLISVAVAALNWARGRVAGTEPRSSGDRPSRCLPS